MSKCLIDRWQYVSARGPRLTEPNRKPKTENSFRFGLHVLGINQGVVKYAAYIAA